MFANCRLAKICFLVTLPIYPALLLFLANPTLATEDPPPPPDIEFSLPANATATEKFEIEFTAKHMSLPSEKGSYFVKFVAFPASNEKDPYHGCTLNGSDNTCLGYSSGWVKFPEFKRDDEMTLSGKITVWVKNADDSGDFRGYLKFALTDDPNKSKNQVKSDTKSFFVTALPPPPPPPPPEAPKVSPNKSGDKKTEAKTKDESTTTEVTIPANNLDAAVETAEPLVPLPKVTATKPTVIIDRKLPATLSAVPAVSGESTVSATPSSIVDKATPSATPSTSSFLLPKSAIIGGGALLAAVFTSLYLGYRHFRR